MTLQFNGSQRSLPVIGFSLILLARSESNTYSETLLGAKKEETTPTSEPVPATKTMSSQIGTTYAHYPRPFIADAEKMCYGRPEIPFVIKILNITPGIAVADIGCGVGSYTMPIAQAVGKSGVVYACDIQVNMIEVVRKHIKDPKQNPYNNIIAIVNRPDNAMLPDEEIDLVWLSQVHFHNFPVLLEANRKMIDSIFRCLKSGGRLVIGDEGNIFSPDDPNNLLTTIATTIKNHYSNAGFIFKQGPIRDPIVATTFYIEFVKPRSSNEEKGRSGNAGSGDLPSQ